MTPPAFFCEIEDFHRNYLLRHILEDHEAFGARQLPTAPYAALRRTPHDVDQELVREFIYRNSEDNTVYHCIIIDWEQLTPSQRQKFKEVSASGKGGDWVANRR